MQTTIEGIYRDGKIELLDVPAGVADETRVLVTFLAPEPGKVNLRSRSIDAHQAAELRARLGTIAADWDRPEMDGYDDHDNARHGPVALLSIEEYLSGHVGAFAVI
jgi:hypothetical protein